MTAPLRLLAWLLALALLLAPVVAVLNGWIAAERWPLQRLRVSGELAHVDGRAVREAVLPHLDRGFFAVRLGAVREAVAALPWVDAAEVRKRWPDRLEVAIVEHRPLARWGEGRILTGSGRIVAVPDAAALTALPQFFGPDDRGLDMLGLYRTARAQLATLGLAVGQLRLSPRGSWSLVLSDGSQWLLGRDEPEARLARFVRLLPRLIDAEARPLLRADLRYAHGFALVWAKAEPARAGNRVPIPGSPIPDSRFSIPGFDSRFPIPGSTT